MVANPIFLWDDAIDQAVITASSSAAGLPPSNLAEPDIQRIWRGTSGSSDFIDADLGGTESIGGVCLPNTNLGLTTQVQVQFGTTQGGGTVYDSGTVDAECDPVERLFVHLFPSNLSGRWIRITATIASFEAGRLLAAPRFQPSRNFSFGFERMERDLSRVTTSLSGVRWIDREEIQHGIRGTFTGLTASDIGNLAGSVGLNRRSGTHRDFLLVLDPDSSNLSRDSVFGYLEDPIRRTIDQPNFYVAEMTMWSRL